MVSSSSMVNVGQLVAVNCSNHASGPSIGKCIQVADTNVLIEWMKGTYTSTWCTWMIPDPQNRRKKIAWTDWIPRESIILFDFELTATNRLRKTTAEHLKLKYVELLSNSPQ